MRPEIDLDHDDKLYEAIEQYAEDKGLRMPRAFRELLERGIQDEYDRYDARDTPDEMPKEDEIPPQN